MQVNCLKYAEHREGKEILADFLKTFAGVSRYGRCVIYEGDIYYIPYIMVSYILEETGETYVFLASRVSEDISVYKADERTVFLKEAEVEERYLLKPERDRGTLLEYIKKKIQLNRRMRKIFSRYQIHLSTIEEVYLPEQTFYGKGKSEYLFLVDEFLQKVDFRNLQPVQYRFLKNCNMD